MIISAHYVRWHYGNAYRDIVRIWTNYLWFIAHFFSLQLLLRTFAAPFRRIEEGGKTGFDLKALAEKIAVNTMMRLVGIVLRTIIIAIGLVTLAAATIAGIATIIIWTLFPLVLGYLILLSLHIV